MEQFVPNVSESDVERIIQRDFPHDEILILPKRLAITESISVKLNTRTM